MHDEDGGTSLAFVYSRARAFPDQMEVHEGPACWDRVARASGELWRWLEECRPGFTRPVAARVLGHDSGDAYDESLRGRNLPPFKLLRD